MPLNIWILLHSSVVHQLAKLTSPNSGQLSLLLSVPPAFRISTAVPSLSLSSQKHRTPPPLLPRNQPPFPPNYLQAQVRNSTPALHPRYPRPSACPPPHTLHLCLDEHICPTRLHLLARLLFAELGLVMWLLGLELFSGLLSPLGPYSNPHTFLGHSEKCCLPAHVPCLLSLYPAPSTRHPARWAEVSALPAPASLLPTCQLLTREAVPHAHPQPGPLSWVSYPLCVLPYVTHCDVNDAVLAAVLSCAHAHSRVCEWLWHGPCIGHVYLHCPGPSLYQSS